MEQAFPVWTKPSQSCTEPPARQSWEFARAASRHRRRRRRWWSTSRTCPRLSQQRSRQHRHHRCQSQKQRLQPARRGSARPAPGNTASLPSRLSSSTASRSAPPPTGSTSRASARAPGSPRPRCQLGPFARPASRRTSRQTPPACQRTPPRTKRTERGQSASRTRGCVHDQKGASRTRGCVQDQKGFAARGCCCQHASFSSRFEFQLVIITSQSSQRSFEVPSAVFRAPDHKKLLPLPTRRAIFSGRVGGPSINNCGSVLKSIGNLWEFH